MDIYRHDASYRERGYAVIAGVDEAGRGPLAGPVVAAAVILPPQFRLDGLRDSKKVPEKERAELYWEILISALAIGVGIVGNEEIDKTDILRATKTAMSTAVGDLRIAPDALIIDALAISSLPFTQFPLVKADAKSASVAAASIIAKHVRDTIMAHYHNLYPAYNFGKHKGYCTREHVEKINTLGPCPIHRRSFKQVRSPELPF